MIIEKWFIIFKLKSIYTRIRAPLLFSFLFVYMHKIRDLINWKATRGDAAEQATRDMLQCARGMWTGHTQGNERCICGNLLIMFKTI
jgi:hypothetical protein